MKEKKAVSAETYVFLVILIGVIVYVSSIMGVGPMFSTMMATAHDLLLNTVFYIMAISVLAGAFAALATNFGLIALLNKLISPIMKPIYGLPGAASLGIVTTFISDNPAILSLAGDQGFRRYFNRYQYPALCNLGTSYGMGLILCTYMIGVGKGNQFFSATACGLLGAVMGSVVSVRLMILFTTKYYQKVGFKHPDETGEDAVATGNETRIVKKGYFTRVFDCILEGGKTGVQMGFGIIPGVLTVCTAVMMLTYGPGEANGAAAYTGAAYEGIALIPKIGALIQPVTSVLFGFSSPSAISFPLTSLGSVGAAMGLVPTMLSTGMIGQNEIAVFTAMGMCWSGYLSTHISMMDAINRRELTSKAITAHTIGGIAAGVAAHYLFSLVTIL